MTAGTITPAACTPPGNLRSHSRSHHSYWPHSKSVSVQLPGAGLSAVARAPLFEIGNLQVTGNGQIGMMQLNVQGAPLKPHNPPKLPQRRFPSSSQITPGCPRKRRSRAFHAVLNEAGIALEKKRSYPRLAVAFALPMLFISG